MTLRYVPMAFLLLIFLSCANVYRIQRVPPQHPAVQKLNAYGQTHRGTLVLKTGVQQAVTSLQVTDGQVVYTTRTDTTSRSVPIHDVQRIVFRDHLVGAGQGFYTGMAVGALAGVVYIRGDFQEMAGLAIVFGAGVGGIGGAIIGAMLGSPMVFVFENR